MKTKLKSFGIKSLAAILSILMVLTGFPLSVFAIDFESRQFVYRNIICRTNT